MAHLYISDFEGMQVEGATDKLARAVAEEVRVFRDRFGVHYNPAPDDEERRIAEALAIEYGKLLLQAWTHRARV